ncbi:MAG: DUF4365 domain-containing protein [Planctomycetaceae bacterium]|jgi:hypothetical protein|nr:DUF4365 domain-containing protein [Planctomycetaceae bacterium]
MKMKATDIIHENKTELNIIQENLSFSYLHAVSSRAGGSCIEVGRNSDNNGVDAHLKFFGKFSDKKNSLTQIDINVQLKSKRHKLIIADNKISFPLSVEQYNKYIRKSTTPFLFVLFHVSDDVQQWLTLSTDELILRKCAYWTGLYGASARSGQKTTLHIPKKNILSVEQLKNIVRKISEGEKLNYE